MQNILLLLEQQKKDLKWMISLRAANNLDKIKMITEKCPQCMARCAKAFFYFSDENLVNLLADIEASFMSNLSQVNINGVYER